MSSEWTSYMIKGATHMMKGGTHEGLKIARMHASMLDANVYGVRCWNR